MSTPTKQAATFPSTSARTNDGRRDTHWGEVRDRFLEAVDGPQRPLVALLLRQPRLGGTGLRHWLSALAAGVAVLPTSIPPEVIQTYLTDPEALPLHDCAACGLAVPVR